MVTNVQKHSKVPSFFAKSTAKAQEIDLEWNGTNYSATLTDTNNVLGNYTFSADAAGISFSVSGNKLTITADKAPSGTVGITATKTGSVRKGLSFGLMAHMRLVRGSRTSPPMLQKLMTLFEVI